MELGIIVIPLQFLTKKTSKYGKSTWSYSQDNSANFAVLAANDEANVAYLSAIPELKESFGLFARETNWWDGHRNPNSRNNAPQRLVDITDIISDSAAEQACKNLDKLSDITFAQSNTKGITNPQNNWVL